LKLEELNWQASFSVTQNPRNLFMYMHKYKITTPWIRLVTFDARNKS